jgi:hypothetical protein
MHSSKPQAVGIPIFGCAHFLGLFEATASTNFAVVTGTHFTICPIILYSFIYIYIRKCN